MPCLRFSCAMFDTNYAMFDANCDMFDANFTMLVSSGDMTSKLRVCVYVL